MEERKAAYVYAHETSQNDHKYGEHCNGGH